MVVSYPREAGLVGLYFDGRLFGPRLSPIWNRDTYFPLLGRHHMIDFLAVDNDLYVRLVNGLFVAVQDDTRNIDGIPALNDCPLAVRLDAP